MTKSVTKEPDRISVISCNNFHFTSAYFCQFEGFIKEDLPIFDIVMDVIRSTNGEQICCEADCCSLAMVMGFKGGFRGGACGAWAPP